MVSVSVNSLHGELVSLVDSVLDSKEKKEEAIRGYVNLSNKHITFMVGYGSLYH